MARSTQEGVGGEAQVGSTVASKSIVGLQACEAAGVADMLEELEAACMQQVPLCSLMLPCGAGAGAGHRA